jgi:glycosyltransferase involved in cell wall biosynthesis
MKIALVSKTNGCFGGASFFAENLGRWLMEAGHEVTQFCAEPRWTLQPYQRPMPVSGLASRLVRHANWRARRWGMVEPLPWEYWFGLRDQLAPFDLFHFHDLYMSVSPRSLFEVGRHKPVILTVHDTSAFTGGCINPQGCRRFEQECGQCPQRSELGWFDFTRSNLRQVRRLASEPALNLVFPSKWIQAEAARSLKWKGRVKHVANGFDPRGYRFQNRRAARALLGLAPDRKIVVIASAALENKLKGVRFALEAVAANRDLNPLTILMGQASAVVEKYFRGASFWMTGFVEDRTRLALILAAADLLLYPSLGDNLPTTIQEAMAAGTPVLAFEVGGVPELVRPDKTGWLVPAGDQEALNGRLREILSMNTLAEVGERARATIHEEFSVAQCVRGYLDLYREVL